MDIRKIIAGVTALTLVCGAVTPAANAVITPFTAVAAAETVTDGALTFKISDDIAFVYQCAQDTVGEVVVPEKVNGATVVCVDTAAFMDCIGVSSIVLPDTVEEIQFEAFRDCVNLSEIKLPKNLKIIPDNAFTECKALKSIELPENLQSIGQNAFAYTGLVDVTVPKSVENIKKGAFCGCAYMERITILNPDVKISNYETTICSLDLSSTELSNSYFLGVIRGGSASTAEEYAKNFGYDFESLDDVPSADLTFTLVGDHYSVSANKTTISGNIAIPAEYEGLPVTELGEKAFWNCGKIVSVQLPETLTTIGDGAFYCCSKLETVNIPEKVTELGESVFYGTALKKVTVPKNVNVINKKAFGECIALSDIVIENPECAIYGDNSTICNEDMSESSLHNSRFSGTIYGISGSTAEEYAKNCGYDFKEIGAVAAVSDLEFKVSGDHAVLVSCPREVGGDVVIPAEYEGLPVTEIADDAFRFCGDITSVTIPDTVKTIGHSAFWGCSGLFEIVVPDSVTKMGNGVFGECGKLQKVTLPAHLTSLTGTFVNSGVTSPILPSDLKTIGISVFQGCRNLREIKINEGIEAVQNQAFSGSSLVNVTLPASVKSVSECAFADCKNLEKITILNPDCEIFDSPDTICNRGYVLPPVTESSGGVDYVALPVFKGVICGYPNSTAQAYAKKYGYYFESITAENSGNLTFTVMGDHVSVRAKDTKISGEIVIPDEYEGLPVTEIADKGFAMCTEITSVKLPDTVNAIGMSAFSRCTALKSIELPEGLTVVKNDTFSDCTSLAELKIPETVTEIGASAFFESGLTEITIPKNVKNIADEAFCNCASLEKITILNPDCVIPAENTVISTDGDFRNNPSAMLPEPTWFKGTIYGYAGSTAQKFAEKCGYSFKSIDWQAYLLGDANCDGQVTIADAAAILQSLANADKYPLSPEGRKNASFSGDGSVSTLDVRCIQQIAAGIVSDQWHEKHDVLDRLKAECAEGTLTKTYPAEKIIGDIWHSGGENLVTFIDELNEKYPIEYLAAPENASPYAVYRLDSGEKLFVFFYDGADFLVPVTRIAVVGELLTNADFKVEKGMTLAEVEAIDSGVKLINSIAPYSLSNVNQTFHMTSEGFWRITYEGKYPDCTVSATEFIPYGGVMTEPISGAYRDVAMTVSRHDLFDDTLSLDLTSDSISQINIEITEGGGSFKRTLTSTEAIGKTVSAVKGLHLDSYHPESPFGETTQRFTIEALSKDGERLWMYIDSQYALFQLNRGEKYWSAVDPAEFAEFYKFIRELPNE